MTVTEDTPKAWPKDMNNYEHSDKIGRRPIFESSISYIS